MVPDPFRIVAVDLAETSPVLRARHIEQEREIAIYDLLESNAFRPRNSPGGPYKLVLSIAENRLLFDIRLESGDAHRQVILSLMPLRNAIKEYFQICATYFKAIKRAPPAQIETLDRTRRDSHNTGANLLIQRLNGKIELDRDTARRLFTLICILHLRGDSAAPG